MYCTGRKFDLRREDDYWNSNTKNYIKSKYKSNTELVQEKKNGIKKLNDENTSSKQEILWFNVFFIILFHIVTLYGFIFRISEVKILTILWGMHKLKLW